MHGRGPRRHHDRGQFKMVSEVTQCNPTSHHCCRRHSVEARDCRSRKDRNGRGSWHGHVQALPSLIVTWIWTKLPTSAEIRVSDVLLHHALRVEERTIDGDGVLHDLEELVALAVIQGEDDALQFRIKGLSFGLIVRLQTVAGASARFSNRPARYSFDVTLDPPAIQNT